MTTTQQIEPVTLLPCPFCGGEAALCLISKHRNAPFVYCFGCCASAHDVGTKDEAIAAWNARTTPAPSQPTEYGRKHTDGSRSGGQPPSRQTAPSDLRDSWSTCLGADVSDWAHENVADMLERRKPPYRMGSHPRNRTVHRST